MLQINLFIILIIGLSSALPEQGRWIISFNQNQTTEFMTKTIFESSEASIDVTCDSKSEELKLKITLGIRRLFCYQYREGQTTVMKTDNIMNKNFQIESLKTNEIEKVVKHYFNVPCKKHALLPPDISTHVVSSETDKGLATTKYESSSTTQKKAKRSPDEATTLPNAAKNGSEKANATINDNPHEKTNNVQAIVDKEGVYIISITVESTSSVNSTYDVQVDLRINSQNVGYLSVVDWPLLPFFGSMCVVYFIFGLAWIIVLALQWQDLLRIQFWIGGVIILGMIEKAVLYAEYQSLNSSGLSVHGVMIFAELVSCLKRTLARMLVIIVSFGFGIVKPRLGTMLHRVVGTGVLYFILCASEGIFRIKKPQSDPSKTILLVQIPLTVLDTAICWWIFSNLVQTTRTLRLRRNIVKLSLYRHFTNTLAFACVASVAFMIWVIKAHRLTECVTDWKELWFDTAYWHLLFSVILLVIMILWRPTNNNQRYAFVPLMDAADDDEDPMMNDAFDGMTIRNSKGMQNMSKDKKDGKSKAEDDLAWVEDNIPASLADAALPSLLDSDEEIMNTKFEMSKME